MSLKEQLEQTKEQLESKFTPEMLKVMHKETADLELANFTKSALQVGDEIPDFTLPNTFGKEVNLYSLLENQPVVITFYRGSWCPYCNLALQSLNATINQVEKANAKLIAISPQTPDNSLSLQEKLELKFEVLSDTNAQVAKKLNLVFKFSPELENVYKNSFGLDFSIINGSNTYELPIPATYIVGKDKKIKYAFLDVDYTKRAEPSEIISSLEKL